MAKQSRSGPAQGRARPLAVRVLQRTDKGVLVQEALHEVLAQGDVSKQDADLATHLVYGYLRTSIRLAWATKHFLKNPDTLPPVMLSMLHLALYELCYLDGIPPRATVHSWVTLIKRRFGEGLGRVANGVLRRMADIGSDLRDSSWYEDAFKERNLPYAEQLSVLFSIPSWIIGLWLKAYGQEKTHILAKAANVTPWPCARVNAAKQTAIACRNDLLQNPDSIPVGAFGICFSPEHMSAPLSERLRNLHAKGELSWQGGGSQAALAALIPHPLDMLWDGCAGRGGKTLALLEQGTTIAMASDTSFSRLQGMAKDAKRLGLLMPHRYVGSAAEPAFMGQAQHILLDVPCSGLGTLARRPDIRRSQSMENMASLYALQQRILHGAWEKLAHGGSLIYMTCAINPSENEEALARFMQQHADCTLVRMWDNIFDQARLSCGMDALFGAVLVKKEP